MFGRAAPRKLGELQICIMTARQVRNLGRKLAGKNTEHTL